MVVAASHFLNVPKYAGLRVSAAEYFALPDDGCRYEVIDGVVCMSPSPSQFHQHILALVLGQFLDFLRKNRIGRVLPEIDVRLSDTIVYRPDLVVLLSSRSPRVTPRIDVAPDLVLEILSPGTEALDKQTKRGDYERFGVGEYWIVDPAGPEVIVHRRFKDRFTEARFNAGRVECSILSGFSLDLDQLKHDLAS